MTIVDNLMLYMSRLFLKFSDAGVIVLDVAHNADHSEAGDFITKEFIRFARNSQIPEVRQNLGNSLKYIALSAEVPENGIQAKRHKASGIKYSGYCVNDVNKGICIFTSLCKMGAVKLDLACAEHRQLLQLLKEEMLLCKRVFPWEDVFMASVRIMDMVAAVGYLQQAVTGRSDFLEAIGCCTLY